MPIKDITIEAFRNDYPGHPEKHKQNEKEFS